MPGSIVAAQAVEKAGAPEQTHLNGHCSAQGADVLETQGAATRQASSDHEVETGRKDPEVGDAESADHAKENGHSVASPAQSKAETHRIHHKVPKEGDLDQDVTSLAKVCDTNDGDAGMHGGAAIADGHPEEKGSSPETTPACSDRPSDSPSCPTNHSKADGSPEAASARSTAVDHVHNSLQTSVVSSAESSTTANHDLPRADEAETSEAGPADVKRGSSAEDAPGEDTVRENGQSGHREDDGRQEQSENGQRNVASEGAESLPTVKINADEGLLTADQRLVESLIAAAAGNTSAEKGDVEVENSVPVRAFALSDCTSSSTLNGGQGPSAEDKLAMATLLGLAGVPPQKSGEVTCSENGEDDDAASAQESSSRPADGSDGDDMDEDSKEANGHKDTKVSGRRSAKRRKEKDSAEGDDNDDDGENEDVEGGKGGRKSKQDDGDEVKPKGRKGKKQEGDFADRNLSREERKMLAIMRQFEQMEQKEKAKGGPTTPRADGRPGERDEFFEADATGSCKKRKEGDDEDAASARKKPRPGDEDKAASSPRKPDDAADAKSATKHRGRPAGQKLTGKQKMMLEEAAGGVLVALRHHRASKDGPHPVLPRNDAKIRVSSVASFVDNEYSAVQKSLRFPGKKAYCWVQAALSDLSEHEPHTRCSPDWLPAEKRARLNPHRRLIDKKRFPAFKSCLAKWTSECQVQETSPPIEAKVKVEAEPADHKDISMDTDLDHVSVKPEPSDETKETEAANQSTGNEIVGVKHEVGEERGGAGDPATSTAASTLSTASKAEVKIPRRELSQGDLAEKRDTRHGPWTPSMSNHNGSDSSRFRDEPPPAQRITTGYGSLAITIPLGGAQHVPQFAWDQRGRGPDASLQVKKEGAGQDPASNNDQRWPRGAESPGVWMGKRDAPSASTSGPNSPSKVSNASNAATSWDRKDRPESRPTKGDVDQDTRWQHGKDSPGRWIGKREGIAAMPSSPRVGDAARNWDLRRTSAWDQPPHQGDGQRENSFSKDAPLPDRDIDRSSAIRNLPDMREMRREPSPPPLRRRVPSPPRALYSGEMRDRGMDMQGGGNVGAGGGLSRESLRREREDALMRDREPPERDPPSRFMRSEIVRSEIRSKVPDRTGDSPRSRGLLNQWDLGPRARSPRPLDRPMDRQRMDMGRAISPPGRDRSLSPRSKELQREMQAARERRGGDRKDEWGRDISEPRRDGSECSPGADDRDLPPRQMLGGPGGAGRGGWWGGSVGRGRGGPGVDDRPLAGIVRRQRPSMFAARRPREDGYSNSPPRNR